MNHGAVFKTRNWATSVSCFADQCIEVLTLLVPGNILNKVITLARECRWIRGYNFQKILAQKLQKIQKKYIMIFEGNWIKILTLAFCFLFWMGFSFLCLPKNSKLPLQIDIYQEHKAKKSWKWKLCFHCIYKNRNKTIYKCIMTLTSHANREVSSTATPTNLTSSLSAPFPLPLPSFPVSHHEHAVLPSLADHHCHSFSLCSKSVLAHWTLLSESSNFLCTGAVWCNSWRTSFAISSSSLPLPLYASESSDRILFRLSSTS